MKTNFKNSQKSLKIYKRKGDTTQMKENKKDTFVSKIGDYKEERLELLNKKIKENFERDEDFFKLIKLKRNTFERNMNEGSLYLDQIFKTQQLLKLTREEMNFLFFGESFEEQKSFLIPEEMIEGQSEEVKNFLQSTNQILRGKNIEGRKIFLNDLQKSLEEGLKGSEDR
jgi:hypothetical protein